MEGFKRIDNTDFEALGRYERQLACLVHSHYLVGVGHTALVWMQEWWKRYASPRVPVNENCAECVASFLKDVGKAYFTEKELREKESAEKKPAAPKKKSAPRKKAATTQASRKAARMDNKDTQR